MMSIVGFPNTVGVLQHEVGNTSETKGWNKHRSHPWTGLYWLPKDEYSINIYNLDLCTASNNTKKLLPRKIIGPHFKKTGKIEGFKKQ